MGTKFGWEGDRLVYHSQTNQKTPQIFLPCVLVVDLKQTLGSKSLGSKNY